MNMERIEGMVMLSVQSECIEKGLKNLKVRRRFFLDGNLYLVVSYEDSAHIYHKRQLWRAVPVVDGYDFSY